MLAIYAGRVVPYFEPTYRISSQTTVYDSEPGDAGYQGVGKREENQGLEVEWLVAMRPGKRRGLEPGSDAEQVEKAKAPVRAKVEHPFLKVKRWFGYGKVRYRGLMKNTQRLALLFGLGNLLTAESQLLEGQLGV